MSPDEFLKLNAPLSKSRFTLFPHHVELWKLKNSGCSLEQIRQFLKINGIETTVNMLSYYFLKNSENNILINYKSDIPQIKKPAANSTLPTSNENLSLKKTISPNIPIRSNSPADLNKIMGSTFDFNALEKAHKEAENAKKNTQ